MSIDHCHIPIVNEGAYYYGAFWVGKYFEIPWLETDFSFENKDVKVSESLEWVN
jgi:hypothetical protein